MAKAKQLSPTKKILIVGVVLIIAQVVFLFLHKTEEPQTIQEAIKKAVDEQLSSNVDAARKEQVKIQLALTDYRANNQGQLPATLNELIPKYFDVIPKNPDTGDPFEYTVKGDRFWLGDPDKMPSGPKGKDKKKTKKKKGETGEDGLTEEEQEVLIASLDKDEKVVQVVYDPSGKRDPFQSFDMSPKIEDDPNKTPLEKYAIGALRLTAVLAGLKNPSAIVENEAGRGYTVKKGTKIGTNGGVVVDIKPNKLLILETTVDFTGKEKTETIEMRLRTSDKN